MSKQLWHLVVPVSHRLSVMEPSGLTSLPVASSLGWGRACHCYFSFNPTSGSVLQCGSALPCPSPSFSCLSNHVPARLLKALGSLYFSENPQRHVSATSILHFSVSQTCLSMHHDPFHFALQIEAFLHFHLTRFLILVLIVTYLLFHWWALYWNITYMQRNPLIVKVDHSVHFLKMHTPHNPTHTKE